MRSVQAIRRSGDYKTSKNKIEFTALSQFDFIYFSTSKFLFKILSGLILERTWGVDRIARYLGGIILHPFQVLLFCSPCGSSLKKPLNFKLFSNIYIYIFFGSREVTRGPDLELMNWKKTIWIYLEKRSRWRGRNSCRGMISSRTVGFCVPSLVRETWIPNG